MSKHPERGREPIGISRATSWEPRGPIWSGSTGSRSTLDQTPGIGRPFKAGTAMPVEWTRSKPT
jgi:hypothetical protein